MVKSYTKKYFKAEFDEVWHSDASAIRKAREQQNAWFNYWQQNLIYSNFIRNFLYSQNGQWFAAELNDRGLRGRSCQQNNVISPIVRKIVSEQYENDPQPILTPSDINIPTKIVKINAGFVESVAYESNTRQIYSRAYHDQLMGWGGITIKEQQESPTSFNKVLRIEGPEHGVFGWYWDPGAKHKNKIDGMFAGRYEIFDINYLKLKYDIQGDVRSFGAPSYALYDLIQPLPKDCRIICRHFVKKWGKIKMVKLEDGAEMPASVYSSVQRDLTVTYEKQVEEYNSAVKKIIVHGEIKGYSQEQIEAAVQKVPAPQLPALPKIVNRQESIDWIICEYLMSENVVLETNILPIKMIPQLYVPGDPKNLNGYEVINPYAANAVTPQRLMNYIMSDVMDNIGRSFGQRVMAHVDAIPEQMRGKYMRPDISALLEFKTVPGASPMDSMPKLISQPTYDVNELAAYQQCQNDVKAVLGRYQENLGEGSNAYGVDAIMQRQMNGDMSIGIYNGNLNDAIAECNKILLDWKKFTYSEERTIILRNKQGEVSYTTINKPTGETDEMGNIILENDMRLGDFTVEVNGGLSFAAQKYAGMKFLGELMATDETLKHDLMDIYIEYSPFQFKNEVNRRLKDSGYINPAIVAKEEGKSPPQPKPNPAEIFAKMEMFGRIESIKLQNKKLKADIMKTMLDARQKQKDSELDAIGKIVEAEAKEIESSNELIGDVIKSYAEIEDQYAKEMQTMGEKQSKMFLDMIKKQEKSVAKDDATINAVINGFSI